jgi:hypothetical protein
MMFVGSSSSQVLNPLDITALGDTELSPTNPTAQVALNSDGTQSLQGNTSSGGTAWYTGAPITSIGDNYWSKLTLNSGSSPNSGTVGVAEQLSSTRQWTWSRSTVGTTTANCTLQIATDSGMSNVVGAATFNVNVTKDV